MMQGLTIRWLLGARSIARQITSEAIGPLSGSLGVQTPINPGTPDTVTFTGNVHVVAIVDTAQGTVDDHINLMSVKKCFSRLKEPFLNLTTNRKESMQ